MKKCSLMNTLSLTRTNSGIFTAGVMLYPEAKPNAAHLALAELERRGKCKAVITQNIDGLHQAAGAKRCWSFTARFIGTAAWKCRAFLSVRAAAFGRGRAPLPM